MAKYFRPFFFGAKLIAFIKINGGLRPIAIGNTLRHIVSKCAGSKALSERQNFFGNLRVGCGTKRGAEIAASSFRNLFEHNDNPKCTVLLKLDFKNAFNSLNRETMLNHVYSSRPELYNYTHCAYGCAILPDWYSATFRRDRKRRRKALVTKKYCEGG